MTWPSISVLVLLSQNKAGSQVGPFAIHRLNITCSFFGQLVLALSKNDLQALRVEATNWPNSASWWWCVQWFGRLFCLLLLCFYPSERSGSTLCIMDFCWKKFYRSQTFNKNEHESVPLFWVFFKRSDRIFESLDEFFTPGWGWNNASWASISDRPWVSIDGNLELADIVFYILELIVGLFLVPMFFFGKYNDDLLVDIVSTKTDLWSLYWLTFVVWFLEVWVSLDAWGILRGSLRSDVIFGVRSRMKGCCWHIGKKNNEPPITQRWISIYIYSWFWNNHFAKKTLHSYAFFDYEST